MLYLIKHTDQALYKCYKATIFIVMKTRFLKSYKDSFHSYSSFDSDGKSLLKLQPFSPSTMSR